MKSPEELLVDAELVTSKIMVLQDWLEDIELYKHIHWLRESAELIRFMTPNDKRLTLHANMLSSLADYLDCNLKVAKNNLLAN
ncbi:hypothetical protein FEM33_15570 [Dyadobacter flavalbus]|uniref:Uncharacterized protein n=1 Tax=Dyadobacter flavalbus TaxID=2579942 RepID=A0A5M8QRE7_9BACT|nr:hypothetical protein [Dyadobacter flavalbus]KAA6438837.1 hypothetical protein FEM33_15570 [Dyadobacter flavalbus]